MHSRGNIVQDHESLNKNSGELVAEEEVQYVEEEYYIEEEVEESVEESAEQQSVQTRGVETIKEVSTDQENASLGGDPKF